MEAAPASKIKRVVPPRLVVTPITPAIGAEIKGIDLREPLTAVLRAEIYAALLAHKVVFLRDQAITREQHIAFAQQFGAPEVNQAHVLDLGKADAPPVIQPLYFKRETGAKPGNANKTWHCDSTFYESPPIGTILRAVKLPPVGGDTIFADTAAAYDGLPDEIKERIDGLFAFHDLAHTSSGGYKSRTSKDNMDELTRKHPPRRHPIVRTHPDTGRKTLNVCSTYVSHIEGMEESESRDLLRLLTSQVEIPEYQVRFKWRLNSIAFWDNRATQHALLNDYEGDRHMERVTILGRWQ